MLVRGVKLHRDGKRRQEPGRDVKILSDRMLRIKGSAAHSRCKYVDRPSRSTDEQLHNNAPHRKCLRRKTTACGSLFVFFRIRRGTFPYSIEDDHSTISQTPITNYTNTCVKLTTVTHLSFSERIAIGSITHYTNTCVKLTTVTHLSFSERIAIGCYALAKG